MKGTRNRVYDASPRNQMGDSESPGLPIAQTCPACKKKHKPNRSYDACSKIKQQMYLRGEL